MQHVLPILLLLDTNLPDPNRYFVFVLIHLLHTGYAKYGHLSGFNSFVLHSDLLGHCLALNYQVDSRVHVQLYFYFGKDMLLQIQVNLELLEEGKKEKRIKKEKEI